MMTHNLEGPHMLHLTGGVLRCPIGQALLQELLKQTGTIGTLFQDVKQMESKKLYIEVSCFKEKMK